MNACIADPGTDLEKLHTMFHSLTPQTRKKLVKQAPLIIGDVAQILERLFMYWVEDASKLNVAETLSNFNHIVLQNITLNQIQADI